MELRRYDLVPGRRDEMIDIFERHFVGSQEADGIRLLGFFRDLDRPDHFVWFRGFPDMARRRAALTAFYTGPVWEQHAAAVRRTMVDTDDVLLLRPARAGSGLLPPATEPLLVRTHPVRDPAAAAARVGGTCLVTLPEPNTYPALPVREDASVVVTAGAATDPAPDLSAWLTGPVHVARLVPTARSPWPGHNRGHG